jgi:hypothetical protein
MVGQFAQPDGHVKQRRSLGRAGIALPAAITALAAVSVLIAGVWVVVDLNAKTSLNRKAAVSALMVAEAGAAHALGLVRGDLRNTTFDRLLKGYDNLALTADDGLFTGYGLASDEQIPTGGRAFGGGRYYVTMVDDPAETDLLPMVDSNNRVMARCRGVMPDGASAEILAVIGQIPFPAIATEGKLKIGGNPIITGVCGGIHANEITEIGGTPQVSGPTSASDTVIGSDCIETPDGSPCQAPLHHQPPIEIPPLTAADVCTDPDFVLRADGYIEDRRGVTPDVRDGSTTNWGFKWGGDKWESDGPSTAPGGVVCADHDVVISKNWGTESSPLSMSIFSTRSVIVSGNPTFTAADPSGAVIVAEGDVQISGNPSSGTHNNYGGMIYAGAQCQINGSPRLYGQLLCKDNDQPSGHKDWVSISDLNADVSGNPEIIFDCTGSILSNRKILSWMQKLGS